MPVLFYVIVVLMYLTARLNNGDVPSEACTTAWAYVGLRALHSLVHITFNHVTTRFVLYVLSNIALAVLWIMYFTGFYH